MKINNYVLNSVIINCCVIKMTSFGMKLYNSAFIFFFCWAGATAYQNFDYKIHKFPENLHFGVSTSAFQVEGGWNAEGKGESVWDRYLHSKPESVLELSLQKNGDVAADSYHNYMRDVEMIRELGVDFYRFSISWSRVMPNGLMNSLNEEGLIYYEKLILEVKSYGVDPLVTMHYNDLPQHLQDLGGWANPEIVNWFEDYARLLIDRFGNIVANWITLNNPASCFDAYGGKKVPPAVNSRGFGDYLCVKHMLLAHAKAYRYFEQYRSDSNGTSGLMGFSLNLNWIDPMDPKKPEDKAITEVYREFAFDLFLHPFYGTGGDFPKKVKDIVAKKSKEEGFTRSRLPKFTAKEISLMKRAVDFIGMNHYTTFLVGEKQNRSLPYPFVDMNVSMAQSSVWAKSRAPWLWGAPYGLYKMAVYISQKFNKPPMIITEHGWASTAGRMDLERVNNMKEYLKALLFAINDGCDIRGYSVWSLMDTFEWTAGTVHRYGLYEVDFESPDKTRRPRASALFYKHIINKRIDDFDWKPPKSLEIEIGQRKKKGKKETDDSSLIFEYDYE